MPALLQSYVPLTHPPRVNAHTHTQNYCNDAKITVCQGTGQVIAFISCSKQLRGTSGLSHPTV